MNRIRTFGCSITSYHNWQYLVKKHPYGGRTADPSVPRSQQKKDDEVLMPAEWIHDGIHLTDYSKTGWGNDIQHIQYANEVYYKNISKDDIIIWQLTSPYRTAINHEGPLNTGEIQFQNVFNGKEMYVDNSMDLPDKFLNTSMYNTLWQLNGVKRYNDKLLVLFGWDSCFVNEEKKEIIKFLKENDIDYIEESIQGWSTRHKFFKKDKDDFHPPQQGYKSFTEDCLLPKLKKLKWLD
jgi:hypothetical protein